MATDRGFSLPVAGISFVGLFLSAIFLGPHAFDLLRLGGGDADKRLQFTQPPIEARLWEDPFAAVQRYRAKLKELCPSVRATPATAVNALRANCPRGEVDNAGFREQFADDAKNLTLVAVLLPGASFLGGEESRRRTRYAVLSGLNAEGFVPDDSERIGLLRTRLCEGLFRECAVAGGPRQERRGALSPLLQRWKEVISELYSQEQQKIDVPYETFSGRESVAVPGQATAPDGKSPRRVVVLWVDDTVIGPSWLSRLSLLLGDLSPKRGESRLRIIGPYGSNDLLKALDQDFVALEEEASNSKTDRQKAMFKANLDILASVQLISPSSTAALDQLRSVSRVKPKSTIMVGAAQTLVRLSENSPQAAQYAQQISLQIQASKIDCKGSRRSSDCVAEAFGERFKDINAALKEPERIVPDFFMRTIGTDDALIGLLVRELCARGLEKDPSGRVILFNEWDAIYARLFAQSMQTRLENGCPDALAKRPITLEFYSYLRGLDGANVDGAPKQVRLVPRGAEGGKDSRVEWPENRDQRDYVRRLADQIKEQEDRDPLLHRVKAIGLIGGDVHDKLVLAQALRPAFSDRPFFTTDIDTRLLHPEVLEYMRNLIVASSLPLSTNDKLAPVFRDNYQTATFLAARLASAASQQSLRDTISGMMQGTYLYEVGRSGAVALSVRQVGEDERGQRKAYAAVAGFVLLVLGGLMLWVPAPAMKTALRVVEEPAPQYDVPTAVLAALQLGAWFFALGVVAELAWPGSIGPGRTLFLALAPMVVFWAFVYPGLRALPAGWVGIPDGGAPAECGRRVWLRLLFLVPTAVALWITLQPDASPFREPFAPFSGVSAWPAQLLRTLGVILCAWFLDFTWSSSANAAREIGRRYFALGQPARPTHTVVPRSHYVVDFISISVGWLAPRFTSIVSLPNLYLRTRQAVASVLKPLVGPSPPHACSDAISDPSPSRPGRIVSVPKLTQGLERIGAILRDSSVWFWKPNEPRQDGSVYGASEWRSYCRMLDPAPRFFRVLLWLALAFLFLTVESAFVGDAQPEIPARGLDDRSLFSITILAHVFGTLIVLVVLADVTVLTWRIITSLDQPRTIYPDGIVNEFAGKLGTDEVLKALATERIAARIEDRSRPHAIKRNTLLDDWIDVHLLAQHTRSIGKLIFYPFGLVALLFVARSRILDNWSIGGAVLVALICFVLWSFAMAAMLNIGAEYARKTALKRMDEDLTWLEGADPRYEKLLHRFPKIIEKVDTMREGAFAPFFEQPMIQAVLVPLGGAGGLKLLEALVLGRQ